MKRDCNWTEYAHLQTSKFPHADAENDPSRYSVQTRLLGKNEVEGSNPFVGSTQDVTDSTRHVVSPRPDFTVGDVGLLLIQRRLRDTFEEAQVGIITSNSPTAAGTTSAIADPTTPPRRVSQPILPSCWVCSACSVDGQPTDLKNAHHEHQNGHPDETHLDPRGIELR